MRISIVNVQAPFVQGGAEYLADSLAQKLQERGHEVACVRIPFKWYPPQAILEHMLACRLLHIESGNPDLVIALKFPAYLLPFPNKKIWLLHQFRQAYELWGTPHQAIPNTPEGRRIREMIWQADNLYLREAKAIYTNSRIVARRLQQYNGIGVQGVLYPPLLRPEIYHCAGFGDYFFYPSRMNTLKRQALAIEAMRFVRSGFRLVLAGRADQESHLDELRNLVRRHKLEDRVTLLGWISEQKKADLMARCYAALYIPYDEDSYGYVTLEAFHSSKPVLTLSDSGGTDEVIEHGGNGLILEPTAEALAAGMEELWSSRQRTQEMGQAAQATLERYQIRWDHILERLVA
ncbi:MAG TPA: glycosyltransferase family 4 protein [Gemmataceae bacterium]|nr:glycosyltransferase family 4 protein [Gemmataceae bacterium]